METELEKLGCIELADIAKDIRCGPFGSAIHKDDYRDSGIPLIRVADTSGPFVKSDDLAFIDKKLGRELARHIVKPGDIVVSQRGTIGQFAMVTDEYEQWVTSANLISILQSQKADFGYLLAFLNSRAGLSQVIRLQSGQVQPKIITDDVKSVRVYLPTPDVQRSISDLIRESCSLLRRSRSLYAEAEALLLAELGLDDLNLSHQPTYTRSFSQAWATGRLDAEHFQPKYQYVINAIQHTGQWVVLDEIATFCRRGAQPVYVENGPVKVVNTRHLGPMLLSRDLETTSEEYWATHEEAKVRLNDVLLYSTGAYIGRTNYYPSSERAIGSNHVTIIRTTDVCNHVFLALFLNALPGLFQTDQRAHGSAQREIYPNDIKEFIVWLPDRSKQDTLAQEVIDAHTAREEANCLLEEAKQRVEEMVLRKE